MTIQLKLSVISMQTFENLKIKALFFMLIQRVPEIFAQKENCESE